MAANKEVAEGSQYLADLDHPINPREAAQVYDARREGEPTNPGLHVVFSAPSTPLGRKHSAENGIGRETAGKGPRIVSRDGDIHGGASDHHSRKTTVE